MRVKTKKKYRLRSKLSRDGGTLTVEYVHIFPFNPVYTKHIYVKGPAGEWVETKDSVKANRNLLLAARRKARGLPTPEQITALRKELGFSQNEFSEFFGGGAKSFQKYEAGTAVPGTAMSRLLWLVKLDPELLGALAKGSQW